MTWQRRAACRRPGVDPDWFHPDRGQPNRDAKRVCATCPVQAECLDWALDTDQRWGIYGGLTERERRRLKRQHAA